MTGSTMEPGLLSPQYRRAVADTKPGRLLPARMPAEWEAHEATWIGWPHHASDWPGKFPPIPWVYAEIARRIAPGEHLRILVNSEKHEARARRVLRDAGVDLAQVEFLRQATDRGWTRDFGPIFVIARDGLSVVDFHFSGWAKYRNWKRDGAVACSLARQLGYPLISAEVDGEPLVLEGGSVDVNGEGLLLTTEECLLDPSVQARNPRLNRVQIEAALAQYLGAREIIWLGKGIAGDDTHGHVDDIARFTGHRTVVLCQEENPSDPNYRALQENRERLEGTRTGDGSRLEVVRLPMPEPLFYKGTRVPASYANFYIANSAVLVPTFNDPSDRTALGILAELFQDRPVIGIHAVDLVWGLGTLHCLSQQQPRAVGMTGQ